MRKIVLGVKIIINHYKPFLLLISNKKQISAAPLCPGAGNSKIEDMRVLKR